MCSTLVGNPKASALSLTGRLQTQLPSRQQETRASPIAGPDPQPGSPLPSLAAAPPAGQSPVPGRKKQTWQNLLIFCFLLPYLHQNGSLQLGRGLNIHYINLTSFNISSI